MSSSSSSYTPYYDSSRASTNYVKTVDEGGKVVEPSAHNLQGVALRDSASTLAMIQAMYVLAFTLLTLCGLYYLYTKVYLGETGDGQTQIQMLLLVFFVCLFLGWAFYIQLSMDPITTFKWAISGL